MNQLLNNLTQKVPELAVMLIVLGIVMKYFQSEMKAERQLCRTAIEKLEVSFNRLSSALNSRTNAPRIKRKGKVV